MSDAPKIDETVVNTVALTMQALIRYMQSKLPGVAVVYDDQLGYDTGITELRAANNLRDGFKNRLPALFVKRSVLRPWEDGHGRRSVVNRIKGGLNEAKDGIHTYRSIHGVYDLEFHFVTARMSELENFEISWLSESGIPEFKQIQVEVPNLGNLIYNIKYDVLEDKFINSQGSYYKTAIGRLSVQGHYYAFHADAKVIKEINAKILTFSNEVLSAQQIVPED